MTLKDIGGAAARRSTHSAARRARPRPWRPSPTPGPIPSTPRAARRRRSPTTQRRSRASRSPATAARSRPAARRRSPASMTATLAVSDSSAGRDTADRWKQRTIQRSGNGADSESRAFDDAGRLSTPVGPRLHERQVSRLHLRRKHGQEDRRLPAAHAARLLRQPLRLIELHLLPRRQSRRGDHERRRGVLHLRRGRQPRHRYGDRRRDHGLLLRRPRDPDDDARTVSTARRPPRTPTAPRRSRPTTAGTPRTPGAPARDPTPVRPRRTRRSTSPTTPSGASPPTRTRARTRARPTPTTPPGNARRASSPWGQRRRPRTSPTTASRS